jgi:elongation factor G
MRTKLHAVPLVLQLPKGVEEGFCGIIDLVRMKQIVWDDDSLGASYVESDIDAEDLAEARSHRERLLETLAEADDAIMEAYLSEAVIGEEALVAAIRRATVGLKLVPVLCGSALKNKGVQPLLNAIVDYLPSPEEVPPIKGVHPETGAPVSCPPDEKSPLAALIFKVSMIEGRKLSYVRLYSGRMTAKTDVFNPGLGRSEKVSRILRMHANKRERMDEALAGSIVGVVGLKDSSTGDTLCGREKPVLLERIEVYEPVISVAVEPKTHADQEKLNQVLEKFSAEDPTLKVKQDADTGQTLLSGMGELHLEIIISRMRREFNTQVNVGKPQVVYRETIESPCEASAVFDREVSGQQHYGEVRLRLKPLPRGTGTRFRFEAPEESVPAIYRSAAEKGVMESLESGTLMGYPVVDVEAVITGGAYKESSGSELAYRVAASMACNQALRESDAYLLDPIMRVEVYVPEDFMGEVIGDLNSRQGKIESMEHKTGVQVIRATVPLAQMFGYSTSLRSATQGRGTFTMHFSHFDRAGG